VPSVVKTVFDSLRGFRGPVFALLIGGFPSGAVCGPADFFRIEVVDDTTGRGVPRVELRTVNSVRHWTDSAGVIAFHELGMMGRDVFFHVESDGYPYPKDAFGFSGTVLHPTPGGSVRITVHRVDIAERLYRVTGEGIYRDSILTGRPVPIREPLLNGGVLGQDTVVATVYRDRIYWFWGDTDRMSHPLGNFSASGATSSLPGRGGLPASVGIDLTYFTQADGFVVPMCPGFGPGLHWIESVFVLPDAQGRERLMARVSSQKGLEPAYAWHLAVWNDEENHFESAVRWDVKDGHDSAHPFRGTVAGVDYLFLYPNHRVVAEWSAVTNRGRYESFTCLNDDGRADRDPQGALLWRWRPGAARLPAAGLPRLVREGVLRREEGWMRTVDLDSGKPVDLNRGSVFWNRWRQRWIQIAAGGAGEIWYSESPAPTGPWEHARRIVSHQAYNFYNPTQHPFLDEDGGRVLYFEGTYTAAFSDARGKTPRYDYNQILYRLDLADPRLQFPASLTPPLDPVRVEPRNGSPSP
jgi:hypothetical protein